MSKLLEKMRSDFQGSAEELLDRAQEIVKALNVPEVRERLLALGANPVGKGSAEFAADLKRDIDRYVKVARESNIRGE